MGGKSPYAIKRGVCAFNVNWRWIALKLARRSCRAAGSRLMRAFSLPYRSCATARYNWTATYRRSLTLGRTLARLRYLAYRARDLRADGIQRRRVFALPSCLYNGQGVASPAACLPYRRTAEQPPRRACLPSFNWHRAGDGTAGRSCARLPPPADTYLPVAGHAATHGYLSLALANRLNCTFQQPRHLLPSAHLQLPVACPSCRRHAPCTWTPATCAST